MCCVLSVVLLFVFTVMLNLQSNGQKVDVQPENIPYSIGTPHESYGILMRFAGGGSEYFCFDGKENKTNVIVLSGGATESDVNKLGYDVFETMDITYDVLAKLIDRFGGIEFKNGADGILKHTGVQVAEMLSKTTDISFRKQVIELVLLKIKAKGFSREDLLFLINNSETTLNFPKGYYIPDAIGASLQNIIFVN